MFVFNLISFLHIHFKWSLQECKVDILLYFSHTVLDLHTAGRMLKLIHCALTVPITHILCVVE